MSIVTKGLGVGANILTRGYGSFIVEAIKLVAKYVFRKIKPIMVFRKY